ncbi:MAG: sorbosone dehydrogenase family protein, partial [Chitinophagaceae bacterium]
MTKNYALFLLTLAGALTFSNCSSQKKLSSGSDASQADLPAPFATPDSRKISKVIGWPDDKKPVAPEGFVVTKFADKSHKLDNPRWIYVAPNGDVLVSQSKTNKRTSPNNILLFRDADKDGNYEINDVFMSGLNQPLGMLVHGNYFYVANTDGVVRYPYTTGQLSMKDSGTKILDLTPDGYNNHWTRNIIASKDGKKFYISSGSASNVAEHGIDKEKRRACILEINPDGSGEQLFASGIRNPVGLDWNPVTGELWTAVNERDNLGDELVPDYVTSVKRGGFYGWPYAYFGPNEDPRRKGERPDLVAKTLVPDVPVGSHTASLGLAFYTKNAFPAKYKNGAFVGQHGSWNRSVFSGYKVVFIPFTNGKPGKPEDFLTGFIADENKNEVYGRPVGVTVLPDGSMLVADDAANT